VSLFKDHTYAWLFTVICHLSTTLAFIDKLDSYPGKAFATTGRAAMFAELGQCIMVDLKHSISPLMPRFFSLCLFNYETASSFKWQSFTDLFALNTQMHQMEEERCQLKWACLVCYSSRDLKRNPRHCSTKRSVNNHLTETAKRRGCTDAFRSPASLQARAGAQEGRMMDFLLDKLIPREGFKFSDLKSLIRVHILTAEFVYEHTNESELFLRFCEQLHTLASASDPSAFENSDLYLRRKMQLEELTARFEAPFSGSATFPPSVLAFMFSDCRRTI
jgi:hypothetical protein